ncbi:MAG: response regulator [Treponema sp.]|jgi:putative two-component system response regulator|nr:response regulator [Treponema sp.]
MKNIKMQRTVLAIDDVMMNLSAYKTILQDYYTVCTAQSDKDALAILDKTQVDIILLDIEMPEMLGIELFGILQKNPVWHNIPVIFITGSASPDAVRQAALMGAKEYLVKPIAANLLLDKTENVFLSLKVDPAVVFLIEKLYQLEKACKIYDRPAIESVLQSIAADQYVSTLTIVLQRVNYMIRNNDYPQAAKKARELAEFLRQD